MTGSSKKARARLAARGPASAWLATRTGPGMAHTYSRRARRTVEAGAGNRPEATDLGDSRPWPGPCPSSTPSRVRYLEVDRQGVVFNMWYLAYLDDAMTAFLGDGGLPYGDMLAAGYDVQVVHTELDWHGPLGFGERPGAGRCGAHRTDVVHARGSTVLSSGPCRGRRAAPCTWRSAPTGRGSASIPAALLAALGPVRLTPGPSGHGPAPGSGSTSSQQGAGAGAEPAHEPAPVVGGQAVEERPCHELGAVVGARRHRLDALPGTGPGRACTARSRPPARPRSRPAR